MKFKTLKILAATAVLAGSMQTVSAKVKTVEKFIIHLNFLKLFFELSILSQGAIKSL